MSLQLRNVIKTYREPDGNVLTVLDIESFQIGPAEQVVLVGASGGGKTSLLNIISGISTPDQGSVSVNGTDITRLPEAARDRFRAERIGFVFQTFNLLPAFSALENVLLGMSFSGKRADSKRGERPVGARRPGTPHQSPASAAFRRRTAARRRGAALANRPSLLLADEPTANVDVRNQDVILDLIREACAESKVALLMVTHSTDVAARFQRVDRLETFNRAGAPR